MSLTTNLTANVFQQRLFSIKNERDFLSLALDVFNEQYRNVPVYKEYCDRLGRDPDNVLSIQTIPFLPISAFKHHTVMDKNRKAGLVFKSSGTGNTMLRSSHFVSDLSLYNQSLKRSFESFIGKMENLTIASLLPGYSENPESSLIHMVEELSKYSKDNTLHQFHGDINGLLGFLEKSKTDGVEVILFGVSFALLDLSESYNLNLSNVTIVETGGMKGKRREITRPELHAILHKRLKPSGIVSEYGMTELLSQAYSLNGKDFNCPSWMKVFVRETQDPLAVKEQGSGALNIVDLANIYSCSFLATDDLGNINSDGSFEVLGRFDHSDIRGCNLLVQ